MANSRAWAVALFLCVAMLAPRAQARKLFAVLPLDTTYAAGHFSKGDEKFLEDSLRTTAVNSLPGWTVLTSDTTIALLVGNGVDVTKCGEESCQLSEARDLSVDKYVSGSVQFVDGQLVASIRLVDTNSGKTLAAVELMGKSTLDLKAKFEKQAASFFARAGLTGDAVAPAIAVGTGAPLPALPSMPSMPALSAKLQSSALAMNVSADALVARDAALKADQAGTTDPDTAARAWSALADIKKGNPYRQEAAARAEKWRDYSAKKMAAESQEKDDLAKLKRLLPLTSLDAKVKAQLVVRFAKLYGNKALASVRNLVPPEACGTLPVMTIDVRSVQQTPSGEQPTPGRVLVDGKPVGTSPGRFQVSPCAKVIGVSNLKTGQWWQEAVPIGGGDVKAAFPRPPTFRAAGLEWQTQPAPKATGWEDAKAYCASLSLAGGGWRLPTKDELLALYEAKTSSSVVAAYSGMDSGGYWSSTHDSSSAWHAGFGPGFADEFALVDGYSGVRCVR